MLVARSLRNTFAALLAGATITLSPMARAETIIVGMVGAVSSTHWPIYVGLTQGYYAAEDLKPDLVFIQSSAALSQQLTAGSLDVALSTGLADPMRAIDKGSSIAIVRIEMQAPPYALLAKPAIKRWADLKGKTISIGGPKDITRIYLERMAGPNGLKPADYDTVFAGATSARFSALQGGAVDAAILLPPFNFYAESAGFTNLGLTIDYAQELGLVLRPAKPGAGDQDHGGREQAQGGGHRPFL
jgi:NitT/TauT family transport system substrate-binding protein